MRGLVFVGHSGACAAWGEFQINTTTAGNQSFFSVATDDAGNFVSVWMSPISQTCDSNDIFFQLFDSNGNKLAGEVTGPEFVDEDQSVPNVAMDANGNFVIVWSEGTDIAVGPCPATNPDGSGRGIFARRYNSSGTPIGASFQVNTTF